MPHSSSVQTSTPRVYPHTVNGHRDASLTLPQMQSREAINTQIRASLGLPPKPEVRPQLVVEGHVCDVPLWSFSKRRSLERGVYVFYPDGSFFNNNPPKG